jgi:tRNA (cmo5U34)-methyltransferase
MPGKKKSASAQTNVVSLPVGDGIAAERGAWSFGGDVAKTFVSHVRRSVPFYEEGHDLVCSLSDFFVSQDSVCYEIGVSTGELIAKMANYNSSCPNSRWIGIDVELSMINTAREHCAGIPNVELVAGDVNTFEFEPSDFIVSYYCIQFIPPRWRQVLFDRLFAALNWGGALVLFEKVRAPDARFQDIATALYTDFKTEQGFSDTEIVSKSKSLRGVLEPFSSRANIEMLERAGFKDIWPVMKYVCFEGFVAIK